MRAGRTPTVTDHPDFQTSEFMASKASDEHAGKAKTERPATRLPAASKLSQ